MSTLYFKESGIEIKGKDATISFTTDAIKIEWSHRWSVQFLLNSVTGNGRYTIEVSNSTIDSSFKRWDSSAENVKIEDSYFDEIMPFKYLGVVYNGGASGGTIDLVYTLANDKFV